MRPTFVICVLLACGAPPLPPPMMAPPVPTPDPELELLTAIAEQGVEELVFGVPVADLFRAIERESEETQRWTELTRQRALARPLPTDLVDSLTTLEALPRVVDAAVSGRHALVEVVEHGMRRWVHEGPEGARTLAHDDIVAFAIAPDGRTALVREVGDHFVLTIEDPMGASTGAEIEGVAPIAPAWDGDALFYAAFARRSEPGWDPDGGAAHVHRRTPSSDQIVFDQGRAGDRMRIGVEDDIAWFEVRRGEARFISVQLDGVLRTLPEFGLGPPPRIASGRIWVAEADSIASAILTRAHLANAWQRASAASVVELGRVEGRLVAVAKPGLTSVVQLVQTEGLGELLPSPPGEIRALRGDRILWSDPTTPPTLLSRVDGVWPSPSRCRIELRRGVARASSHAADRWVVEAFGALGVSVSLAFRPGVAAWIERGGGWVYVDVPGGGGFASDHHRRGRGRGRERSLRDFVDVFDDSFEGLNVAVYGRGHGAVFASRLLGRGLVSGVLLHDPLADLFAPWRTPAGDTLRGEYGAPRDAVSTQRLLEISPYHRIIREHEATWIEVARDSRIPHFHGAKLAAGLSAVGGSTWFVEEPTEDPVARWSRSLGFLESVTGR